MKFIKFFEEVSLSDIPLVGGKNASLGEMIKKLSKKGILIPSGFAVTSKAYWYLLKQNKLNEKIKSLLNQLDEKNKNLKQLEKIGKQIRNLIENASFPKDLEKEIIDAYKKMEKKYGKNYDVAVRSSATAEDLPEASFAGQQETFLNVHGQKNLLDACKKSFASLFTNRAISYRQDHNFDHMDVALSIGVQKMIRSDLASAGVIFTLDTESGFKDVIFINSSYGLGESVVKGVVNPDEFYVHKQTLQKGFKPILKKRLGSKKSKLIYSKTGDAVKTISVADKEQKLFSLTNEEILELAKQALIIEEHYSKVKKRWMPMDIEWAKDGKDGKLYIVQARPETVHSLDKNKNVISEYVLKKEKSLKNTILATGKSVGRKIASGKARIINSAKEISKIKKGEILVTDMTDPDWEPAMKIASGIVTNRGGRTCFSGDSILLTNKGFMKIEDVFYNHKDLYVPSLNRLSLKIEWKKICDCMKRKGELIKINVSQSGRMKNNTLKLTGDHKVLTIKDRELIEKEIGNVIKDREMILLAQKIPSVDGVSKQNKKLAYLLGAISTDGSVYLSRTHGEVQLIQKPTDDKKKFIETFCTYMKDVFEKNVSISVKKTSSGFIRGKLAVGNANAYRFYGKKIAERVLEYKSNLVQTLLMGDDELNLYFLAGVIDGDGSFSSKNRRINIYCSKVPLLQAIMISCLRLGFVPQVTINRTIFNIQIVEDIDRILSYTNRVKGISKRLPFGTRFFSAKQLLSDIKDLVNYKGRVKPFINNNLLIDAEKIKKFILERVSGKENEQLKKILNSDFRMHRVGFDANIGIQNVYNIEVEDNHNYIVFTERYSPVLVNNCHASIVSRELGIPAIVGVHDATEKIKTGQQITIDCSSGEVGVVYSSEIPFEIKKIELKKLPKPKVELMLNVADPDQAFNFALLPQDGVGLARIEFIISNSIKIHPNALIYPEKIKDKKIKKEIEELTFGYKDKKQFYIDTLAQEAGTIAAAFWPKPVIIRLSDFKSNEYRELIGGKYFEPVEENPMLGFRGASRYYNEKFKHAFALECLAIKKIRKEMGFTNVKLMIPFVRTIGDAKNAIKEMNKYGLTQKKDGLQIYMMCEVPSNVLLIDDFSKIFDGFSIGSNDLTQTVLAVDRDSQLVSNLFDERNEAVKLMMEQAINGAKKNKTKIGICGQAPSDFPELAKFLIKKGIDSISLNPDSLLKTLMELK